jgi:hypothetical protein
VIVSPTQAKREQGWDDGVALDKDREWVERRILEPRRRGEPVAIRGRIYEWSDVEQLRITASEVPSETIIGRL